LTFIDLFTVVYAFCRWKEAKDAGKAPPVVLVSTSEDALKSLSLEDLKAHAWSSESTEL